MYRCVAPTLDIRSERMELELGLGLNRDCGGREGGTNLVVEPSMRIKVFEERGIGLSAPEIHICDLEVAPDLQHDDVSVCTG